MTFRSMKAAKLEAALENDLQKQLDPAAAYADLPVVKSKDAYSLARWQIDAHASWKSSGNTLLSYEDMKGAKGASRSERKKASSGEGSVFKREVCCDKLFMVIMSFLVCANSIIEHYHFFCTLFFIPQLFYTIKRGYHLDKQTFVPYNIK